MLSGAEVAALVMAVVAVAGLWINARKATAETTAQSVEALSALLKDFAALRDQLDAAEDSEEDCQAKLDEVKRTMAKVAAKLSETEIERDRLRVAAPALAVTAKIAHRSAAVRKVLDACRDGIVLSEIDGGVFVYVNRAFAAALGLEPEEVLAIGWRELIHPDDLHAAESTEGEAWSKGGETSNRYRHRAGYFVRMRWHFTAYDDATALSIVWFERRRTDPAPDII